MCKFLQFTLTYNTNIELIHPCIDTISQTFPANAFLKENIRYKKYIIFKLIKASNIKNGISADESINLLGHE
jgi:hypothetical protein